MDKPAAAPESTDVPEIITKKTRGWDHCGESAARAIKEHILDAYRIGLLQARIAAASPVAGVSDFDAWWNSVRPLPDDMSDGDLARLAWNAAILAQPSAEGDGWIAVTERLPRTGAECLVVYDGVVQRIAYCREGLGFACVDGYVWRPADEIVCDPIHDNDVTHWRALPAPPSGQGEKRHE